MVSNFQLPLIRHAESIYFNVYDPNFAFNFFEVNKDLNSNSLTSSVKDTIKAIFKGDVKFNAKIKLKLPNESSLKQRRLILLLIDSKKQSNAIRYQDSAVNFFCEFTFI